VTYVYIRYTIWLCILVHSLQLEEHTRGNFLAGLEVELERLRGRLLLYVSFAFLASLGLALLVGYTLFATGQVISPWLMLSFGRRRSMNSAQSRQEIIL